MGLEIEVAIMSQRKETKTSTVSYGAWWPSASQRKETKTSSLLSPAITATVSQRKETKTGRGRDLQERPRRRNEKKLKHVNR